MTNIPVSLCEYALVNRKVNQLKLYIYLKLNSEGYVAYRSDNKVYKEWAKAIGIGEKTIKSSLYWLIKKKWVTVNGKKGLLKIIGYEALISKLNLSLRTGVLWEFSRREDYIYLKAFCCGVVITYYLRKKRYFDRQSGRINGGLSMNCNKIKGYYPMPNSYIAECLKVSLATACRYKQEAEKGGYIKTKSNYSFLMTSKGERIKLDCYSIIQGVISDEEIPNRLRKGREFLKIVEADSVHSLMECKKKSYDYNRKK
ncbi:hypothetical protein [Dysgonomonas sp. 520]|uniref:hypothetical protein n=1 Tax=Dysgonomonas sp. 520 TaxID=2302931 RepID=UPI0013D24019|nr:hypothetical protein [Dysgonomonas sp. 520]NDW11072.1 hypothetical protein [Dysgonomonas sp. 520]